MTDLERPQNRLDQVQKERDAENHDDDRQKAPHRSLKHDIAEARRGQRRYGEIHGVYKIINTLPSADLCLENKLGYDEDEDEKVDGADMNIFIFTKSPKIAAQSFKKMHGPYKPQNAERTQKRQLLPCKRQEKRSNHQYVGDTVRIGKELCPITRDIQSRQKIGQDIKPKEAFQKAYNPVAIEEG